MLPNPQMQPPGRGRTGAPLRAHGSSRPNSESVDWCGRRPRWPAADLQSVSRTGGHGRYSTGTRRRSCCTSLRWTSRRTTRTSRRPRPFELREVGRASDLIVFEFQDDRPYWALDGSQSLNFLPKAGMTFDDLLLQKAGAKWIGARDPIHLSMSMPGDDTVPSGLDRRGFFDELGARALPGQAFEILESRFSPDGASLPWSLQGRRGHGRRRRRNAVLPQPRRRISRCLGGSRRLAWAVGRWLQISSATDTAGQPAACGDGPEFFSSGVGLCGRGHDCRRD